MAENCFDFVDVLYLSQHFTITTLRREIERARDNAIRAITPDTPEGNGFPYDDYIAACQQAIKDLRYSQLKPTPGPGRVNVGAIKAQNDIVAVIEGYTKLRKAGKNFTGRCVFHEDKHPSLTVYPDQQSWYCFSCNKGGDVFDFIMAAANTDFKGAAAVLGGM